MLKIEVYKDGKSLIIIPNCFQNITALKIIPENFIWI